MTSVILLWCCFHLLSTITIYVRANPVYVNKLDHVHPGQKNLTDANTLGTNNLFRDSEDGDYDQQLRHSNRLLGFEDTTENVDRFRRPQADVLLPENPGVKDVTPHDLETTVPEIRRCPDEEEDDADFEKGLRIRRAARHIYATTWPRGVIPFQFQWGMEAWQKHMVRRVMAVWESRTCVRFREWPMAYDR